MMMPGINVQLQESSYEYHAQQSKARIGYGVNVPEQDCDREGYDAEGVIGLGLTMQGEPYQLNAGFGAYTVNDNADAPVTYQAWLFAIV